MANPVRFRIIERNVQRLAAPGGPMGDMLNDVTRSARTIAIATAPVREGRLKRSININLAKPNGYLQLQGILYANARHARWVHEGVEGRIYPNGKWLAIPRGRWNEATKARFPRGSKILKKSVRGQRANPFLSRAISSALVKERRVSVIGANRIG